MNASDLVRRLHQHRMWANQELVAAARQLTVDQLHQPLPIGQGSAWKTLTHLLAAEYVWIEALHGNETPLLPGDAPGKIPGNQEANGAIASLDDLESNWRDVDRRWRAYLATLTDEMLDQTIHKISVTSGTRRGTRCADVLLHVCTHAQYTASQMVNMLRHFGVQPLPDVMLITLARQEPAIDQ